MIKYMFSIFVVGMILTSCGHRPSTGVYLTTEDELQHNASTNAPMARSLRY